MAEPGASLAMELRRLLPELRRAVGDDRRVLVGFDRGGWSPALFAHMDAEGFDVLTWRKGFAEDVDPDLFTDLTYVDETGRGHTWRVADTTVDLPIGEEEVFTMRQVSLTVPGTKTGRENDGQDTTRQIHILTTRTDLGVEEVIYRMGSRWRQENYFRFARMHFDLDSHDAYATTDDDPTRMVPNPTKKKDHTKVLADRERYDRAWDATDADHQEESPHQGPRRQGKVRPGLGRDRRGPTRSGVPTTRGVGADHQQRPRRAHRRPTRRRSRPGHRPRNPPGHPRPAAPGPGRPRPTGPGHPNQAHHPRHPDRRVQHRHHPRPGHPSPHRVRPCQR